MIDKTLDKINKLVPQKWQWILSHEGFRKYFKNTGWMFVGQLSMLVSLIANVLIARYLGPEEFGSLSYVFAFVGLFAFIANLGVGDVIIKELVEKPEKRDIVLGTAFRLFLFSGFIAFMLSSCSIFFIENNPFLRFLVVLYSSIFLFSAINVIPAYFQSTVLAKKNAKTQVIATIVMSAFKIFLIFLGKGLVFFVVAFILDYVFLFILYIYSYSEYGLSIKFWSFDKKLSKKFIKTSLPLMLSSAAGYLLLKIDLVMVKYFLGELSVGVYSAAVKMTEIWNFIPLIICTSLFPVIISSKKNNEILHKKRLHSFYIMLFVFGFLVALFISIFSRFIIYTIYGVEYIQSVKVLQVYSWSAIGFFLVMGINKILLADNRFNLIFLFSFLAVLLNIFLNLFFIPKIGLLGAAWSTLFSYSIAPLLFFLFYYYKNK